MFSLAKFELLKPEFRRDEGLLLPEFQSLFFIDAVRAIFIDFFEHVEDFILEARCKLTKYELFVWNCRLLPQL